MSEPLGLREAKRRAAMKHVQTVAMKLFDERGYANVTIEQIAAAADVSASSIYRYFTTKEGIILVDADSADDEWDTDRNTERGSGDRSQRDIILEVQRHLLTGLTVRASDPLVQSRMRYLSEVPDLREAMAVDIHRRVRSLISKISSDDATGEESYVFEVAFGATYGAALGALQHWFAADFDEPLEQLLTRTFDTVNSGILPKD